MSRLPSSPWSSLTSLGLLLISLSACASKQRSSMIGVSTFDELENVETDANGADAERSPEAAPEDVDSPEEGRAHTKIEVLALAALKNTPSSAGAGPDLAFALVDRAADLPWILTIENRSKHPVEVAADPALLRFELFRTSQGSAEPSPSTTTETAPETPTARCGATTFPASVPADAWLSLEVGQFITFEFDPRTLCQDPSVLSAGTRVKGIYGFPLQTKKVWSKGKASEIEVEQKEPFVARVAAAESLPVALPKHLIAPSFELGETYPLEQVRALPQSSALVASSPVNEPEPTGEDEEDAESSETASSPSSAPAPTSAKKEEEKPPLSLRVSPLAPTQKAEATTITVTLKNQSAEGMRVFLRRELFVYEILGPNGGSTCRMPPADRSPDPANIDRLNAGASRSLTTRLAEACPPGTFSTPGTYSVGARFESTQSGQEHGLDAFVGAVLSEQPVRFVIQGKEKTPPSSKFRVNTSR